jgi:hypothetical protein
MNNCVALGALNNFWLTATDTVGLTFNNCSSLNASGTGFLSAGVTGGATNSLNYCIDAGSVTPVSSNWAVKITFESNAEVISSSTGIENCGLLPSDPYFLGASFPMQLDAGYDHSVWRLDLGNTITVNGLTFSTAPFQGLGTFVSTNQESAIRCTGQPIIIAYCSFLELGPYGANLSASSSITNCFFNTNGSAIKTNQFGVTIENNVGWECGGGFICNFGSATTIENNSSWGCAYGEYDSAWSTIAALISNIFGGSSVYDYSGYGVQTYADIGTLDPNTPASVDSNSTRLDPLFRNTLTGDLRLQALANGNYFQSPAIGKGPGGADMGAFSFTYGAASTSYTTIDFSASDATGPVTGTYRNPDTIIRQNLAIHLSEGDQENGAPYSVDSTQKLELVMAWNPSANDMPTAQVAALLAMFNSTTNAIRIDLGGMPGVPTGYRNAYFVRQHGFEFTELSTIGISDTGVPTPVKEIVVRLA